MLRVFAVIAVAALALSGCAFWLDKAPVGPKAPEIYSSAPEYIIGPGDSLQVFVWRSAELTVVVPVRPDGRFSMPLLQDVQAAGKTPSQVASDIETGLKGFVREPVVTVIVQAVAAVGGGQGRVSVVGEAVQPRSVNYRAGLTLLDVMIEVGGLTQFANGNDARLVRMSGGRTKEFRVRVADLMKDGDTSANVELAPGDVIRIPERWF
jgi:polysaccharide export outer membrane protein